MVRKVASLLLALLILTAAFGPIAARAQIPVQAEPGTLESLVEQAQEDGYQIILVPQGAATSDVASGGADIISATARFEVLARKARGRLVEILSDMDAFPQHVHEVLKKNAGLDGSPWWIVQAFVLAVAFLVVAYLVVIPVRRWMASRFENLYTPEPEDRTDRLIYPLQRVILKMLGVALQIGLAAMLVVLFGDESVPWRSTMMMTVVFFGVAQLGVVIFEGMIGPDLPRHRMIHLSDEDAQGLYRGFVTACFIAAPVGGICVLMDLLGIDRGAHTLMLICSTLLAALLFSGLAIRYRDAVARAMLGPANMGMEEAGDGISSAGPALRVFASSWHAIAATYFMGAWFVSAIRLLLEEPGALGLIMSPLKYGTLGFYLYAVSLLILDRFMKGAAPSLDADDVPFSGENYALKQLIENVIAMTLALGAGLFIFQDWFAVSLESSSALDATAQIIVVGVLAYIAFNAARIKIDGMIALEGGDAVEALPGDEGGQGGASRLATLLPIFRNFLLAVIVATAGMVILSEMGVDIAPLFAGAGVVGLAVGFGAQTLIRDIFSGAFFLLDDAFRKGEYIETDGTRGTVEKISVRSMQLRHHLGPLHTIPFGEIKSLTNYSRDWVIMKLPLRLTYDTDPEKVRKLIKKLGQELLEHPEIGSSFLEPLKAQGVRQMEDSAMIFSVKFMTKPGDQFVARKIIYAKLRELFESNGIRFATREVTVRLADETSSTLSDKKKEAVSGAVAPVLDQELLEQQGAGGQQKDDR
ncbi:mechanosensitive ion channel family protein [Nisaea sp.]|uniref:mechanosensitive ion channel family protein n=1 Tax=Nisaea sp. TaxID=2024842 RepID=UPI00329887E0